MATKKKLRFGIAIPQMFSDGAVDTTLISKHMMQAESLGYDSAWVQDQVIGRSTPLHPRPGASDPRGTLSSRDLDVGPMPLVDPFTLLAFAGAITRRIKLGTSVVVSSIRSPVHLAKTVASLDQLTGGRLALGVGLGGIPDIYPAFGLSPECRISRFEEGISLIKRLWTESQVSYKSRFVCLYDVTIEPKPLQKPHPPILIGARDAPALKRAARLGDGWLGGGSSDTPRFKWELDQIKRYLEQEGRDPASFHISKRVYIAVDANRERASEKLQQWFYQYYRNAALAVETAIWGSEEECIEKLSELPLEEVNMLMLNPVYDIIEQSERLAKDILPKL